MTMIVGMSLGDYVLIASDRRQVYMINGEIAHVESDSVNKIIECPIGFITGNGYVPLLNEFKNELKKRSIESTDEILEIAKAVSSRAPSGLDHWKKQTNWMFTYVASTDIGKVPRIAIIEAKDYSNIKILREMNATIWAKIPYIDVKINELNSLLRHTYTFSSIKQSAFYHISLLKKLFEYGGNIDPTVCSDFNVCLHFRDGGRFNS